MNAGSKVAVIIVFLLTAVFQTAFSQGQKPLTLRECIDYALQNNIQVKSMEVNVKSGEASLEQAKAGVLPTLNAGAGEDFSHKTNNQGSTTRSFTGNYSLRSEVTLFNGYRLKNSIEQQKVEVNSSKLGVEESKNSIELSVTTAYLQVLYARESVLNAENTLKASEAEMNRAKILYESGYIAESNYAQVQAQYSSDAYLLVTARNNLSQQLLNLKQLLELDINEDLQIYFPELKDEDVSRALPDKLTVYQTALSFMPEIQAGKLAMNSAELGIKIAKAGLFPSLSMSASLSTGYDNAVSNGFATQLGDNFYQNAGLTLSIPIFNQKQVKTSVSKARLGYESAQLNYQQARKDLLSRVESAYLDAVSAQSRFISAREQLNSTLKSYTLVEDQFNLGMKNTVDLLTAKTNYLSAQQEYLQAKYSAILGYKLLDFYQEKRIEL